MGQIKKWWAVLTSSPCLQQIKTYFRLKNLVYENFIYQINLNFTKDNNQFIVPTFRHVTRARQVHERSLDTSYQAYRTEAQ